MATSFKKIPSVDPWPNRKMPQPRFDVQIKASMDQMSGMVAALNEFITLLNAWATQVENNVAAAAAPVLSPAQAMAAWTHPAITDREEMQWPTI